MDLVVGSSSWSDGGVSGGHHNQAFPCPGPPTHCDAQCDLNGLIKEPVTGAHSPKLIMPVVQFDDEVDIAIDPLRHSVSHLPTHNGDNTPTLKWGCLQLIASSGKASSRIVPTEALCN